MNKSPHSCDNDARGRQNYYSGLRVYGVVVGWFPTVGIIRLSQPPAGYWLAGAWAELGNTIGASSYNRPCHLYLCLVVMENIADLLFFRFVKVYCSPKLCMDLRSHNNCGNTSCSKSFLCRLWECCMSFSQPSTRMSELCIHFTNGSHSFLTFNDTKSM